MEVFGTIFGLAIATFSAGMAWLQWRSAERSLAAANEIAREQSARADRALMDRAYDFQNTMLIIADEAEAAVGIAIERQRADDRPGAMMLAEGEAWATLAKLSRAATAVLSGVPAHASLALAGGALSDALNRNDADGLTPALIRIRDASGMLKDAL